MILLKIVACVSGVTNTSWLEEIKDTAVIRNGSASGASSSAEHMQQVESKMLNVTQDGAVDVDSEKENVCMVCLHLEPSFVLAKCGHCGLCTDCWAKLLIQQNNKNHGREIPTKEIKWNVLREKHIDCPYCRASSKTVHRSRYKDRMYICG